MVNENLTENSQAQTIEQASTGAFTISFADLFKSLIDFWYVFVVMAVGLGAIMGIKGAIEYSPVYSTSATFTINAQSSSATGGISTYSFYYDSATAKQLADVSPYILGSNLLQDMVCEDLKVSYMPASLSATSSTPSNLFYLTATGKDPQLVYDTLNSAIKNFPTVARYVVGNVQMTMITNPYVPTSPSNGSQAKNMAQRGALIGLAIALGWVFLFTAMRRTIKTKDDVKNQLGIEALGVFPNVSFKKYKEKIDRTISIRNDRVDNEYKENVRLTRNMFVSSCKPGDKIFIVTSTAPNEGKTTVISNLVMSLSDLGKKVILIDGDLRNPSIADFFNLDYKNLDYDTVEENYSIKYLEEHKIFYMKLGNNSANTARILRHKIIKEIFDKMRKEYDYILVDTPPSGLVSDTIAISQNADAAVYVVLSDAVRTSKIAAGIEGLVSSDLRIMGVILNGVSSSTLARTRHSHKSGYGYGYGYYSSYGGYGKYGKYGKYKKNGKYGKYGKYKKNGKYGKYGKYGSYYGNYGKYGYGYDSKSSVMVQDEMKDEKKSDAKE